MSHHLTLHQFTLYHGRIWLPWQLSDVLQDNHGVGVAATLLLLLDGHLGPGERLHLRLPLPDDEKTQQHHQHDGDDEEVAPLL